MLRLLPALCLLCSLLACQKETPPPPAPVVAVEPPEAVPGFRLPEDVTPTAQAITLSVDPAQTGFSGKTTLTLSLSAPRRTLWLHAVGLTLSHATAQVGAEVLPLEVLPAQPGGPVDMVGLKAPRRLPAGALQVSVDFAGEVTHTDDRGLFVERDGESPFLFTQFESIDARRAFPCLDEPRFKLPWTLTLDVPTGQAVFANTTPTSTRDANGRTETVFAPTLPLPSYLVAFGVGPFAVVDGGTASGGAVPVRLIVAKGHEGEAQYAAGHTARIVDELERWFDLKYPYGKLDVLVIPHLSTFAAMENPGLITIVAREALAAPAQATRGFQQGYVSTMAHELAHQWFGDLVTSAWWEDIWLNESFASWMGDKTVAALEPSWQFEYAAIDARHVLEEDALTSVRQVRQPITANDDIVNAFDGITYSKGQVLLSMLEQWLTPPVFQAGVRRYIAQHANGVARRDDFLSALAEASGHPEVAKVLGGFLDQPGVPLITPALECEADHATLTLSQERFLPLGSTGNPHALTWTVPVCAWLGAPGKLERTCFLLDAPTKDFALPACPKVAHFNAAGVGYYRTAWPMAQVPALVGDASPFTLGERLVVLDDLEALLSAGHGSPADALTLLPQLSKISAPRVLAEVVPLVSISRHVLSASDEVKYTQLITRAFGARARKLGFVPGKDDSEDVRHLRGALLGLVGARCADPALLKEARARVEQLLTRHGQVDPEPAEEALGLLAPRLDPGLFERLLAEARATEDAQLKPLFLSGLTAQRDPAIAEKAIALTLDPAFDARETPMFLFGPEDTAEVRFAFIQAHVDELLARFPAESRVALIAATGAFCDDEHRTRVAAFFTPRLGQLVGGRRALDQTLEAITLCQAARAKHRPELEAWFQAH
jgi:alanyl aminopeptidase